MRGAKTISVDPLKHVAYLFQPRVRPGARPRPGLAATAAGGRRPRRGRHRSMFFAISH